MTKKSNSNTDTKGDKSNIVSDNMTKTDKAEAKDNTATDNSTTNNKPNISANSSNVGDTTSTTTSQAKVKSSVDKEMSDGVFGLIVLAILIALITWAVVSVVGNNGTVYMLGKLDAPNSGRVGESMVMSYDVDNAIENGTTIEWYVDDVCIDSYTYDGDSQLQYHWKPTQSGRHTVQLRVGADYTDTAVLTIANPLVVVNIDDITMQYGDDMPQLTYTVSGLLGSDSWEDIGCSGIVECADCIDGVGIYSLTMSDTSYSSASYELQCNSGNLIVAPRRVAISNSIIKQYDGTNTIAINSLELQGIIEGDDVGATTDMLYFCDKNVGIDKEISTYNIQLVGDDSSNYTLDGATICGTIVAKQLTVEGATVDTKVYDGSTSATISYSGQLSGVIDGDVVAIGYMDARYTTAKVGKNKPIEIDSITLVGNDSGNYIVDSPSLSGTIVAKYLDLLLGSPAVPGDNSR